MDPEGPDGIKAQQCRGDFWIMLEAAMAQAGGHIPIEQLANMPLKDAVDLLAQNGIRMVYSLSWHIDTIERRVVDWEKEK